MNLPGVIVDLPTLTDKDIHDIKDWGIKNGADFIAASFVRKASDVVQIREVLGEAGKGIQIICKIENLEGLENYDAILDVTDGVSVEKVNGQPTRYYICIVSHRCFNYWLELLLSIIDHGCPW